MIKMEKLTEFVSSHLEADTSRLMLNRSKWPDIDMELAVNCIESRRKLKGKVQEWYDEPRLIFPVRLSAEQCSSTMTAAYKATLAERIAGKEDWKTADLTGGFGVDSWQFAKKGALVLYNEMQPVLCEAARHNFQILGAENIETVCSAVVPGEMECIEEGRLSPSSLLSEFRPDIIYMDPARRGEGGRKVFLIEECTPDVISLKDELFSISRHVLLKLSPMADITMVCGRLGNSCREVHIVASGGECKELLVWMDREWDAEYRIITVVLEAKEVHKDFSFLPSEERNAETMITPDGLTDKEGLCLFEPGKALMKSGAFDLICERFGISKLGKSTHYYIFSHEDIGLRDVLRNLGKVFRIIRCTPLDKRKMKEIAKDFPRAEVTARNIPMDTETLRKKLGTASGGNIHIFGLKSDRGGNLLIAAERV